MFDDERDWRKANRVIDRTADAISKDLCKMLDELSQCAAPQMAIELVVRRLAGAERYGVGWLLQLIMEDQNVREAYYSEIAKLPAIESQSLTLNKIVPSVGLPAFVPICLTGE
jgi:hypothetical protein